MSITTYAELKTAVANWLDRSDLTSRIPEFIALAEAQIARDLRIRENEKRVTATISTEYFDIPTDFIEMRNFQLNTTPVTQMEYASPEQLDIFNPDSTAGNPLFYTIHGSEFQVKPVPDGNYTAEMTYWYRPTAFSADADTNTILTRYPDIYLYGALATAAPFIDDDTKAQTWITFYSNGIKTVNDKDKAGRYSGSSIRMRSDVGII